MDISTLSWFIIGLFNVFSLMIQLKPNENHSEFSFVMLLSFVPIFQFLIFCLCVWFLVKDLKFKIEEIKLNE